MSSEHLSHAALVEALGADDAGEVLSRIGSWSVAIPAEHDLHRALGSRLFGLMVRHFGGLDVTLPAPPRDSKKAAIIDLLDKGLSVREITRRLNVSQTWVHVIKRQTRGKR